MKIKIDGKEAVVNLAKVSKRLLKASSEERENYEVSPSGYGIHWSMIDEDISIDSLLGIDHVSSVEVLSNK
jgi:hypothetical protein